jgi:hypothetical protein
MPSKTGPWAISEDEIALRNLQANKTFTEVGRIVGRSRNSVISRARRKNWDYPGRTAPFKPNTIAVTAIAATLPRPAIVLTKPTSVPYVKNPTNVEKPVRYGFAKLDDVGTYQCRFIAGEARERVCCGAKVVSGSSWCSTHYRAVFTKPGKKTASSS